MIGDAQEGRGSAEKDEEENVEANSGGFTETQSKE